MYRSDVKIVPKPTYVSIQEFYWIIIYVHMV